MVGSEQDTPSEYTMQYESAYKGDDACADDANIRESPPMAREEDEGLRLDQVLEKHGLSRAKLAKKIKMSASAVQKWKDSLSAGNIKPASWNSCARALRQVGIDPAEVRPHAKVTTETNIAPLVKPIMAITDRDALSIIMSVLEIDDADDRAALLEIVRFKLQ